MGDPLFSEISMAEQPFCITQPSLSCSDSSCFPSQDTPGQSQSYRLPAASELSPHFFQHPNLSPEQPYQVGFELSKLASPWLSSPPVWASQSMGGAMETNESSSSTLQRLDSFTHAFANRNLCMFTSSSPSLSAPLPSCVTTPTDSALCQLLSQKPLLHQGMVPMQTQPLGAQQKCPETESQPMRRYDQAHSRQSVNVQDSMQPEYSYGQQQDPYDLQQELPYYHLHPHPNGSTAHTMANAHAGPSALHNADMVLPSPHSHAHAAPTAHQLSPSPAFPPPHGQICTMQPFQQSSPVDPPHTIPQNHCFYLQPELQHSQPSHRQNPQNVQPSHRQNPQNVQPSHRQNPQNVQPSHRLSHQQSSYHMQQQVHMQTEPLPFYRSDSTHLSPTLLSPTHFSQTEQSPTPCQPHPLSVAATPSPCDQGQRSDLEFHPGGQLQPSSTSPSQWPQVQLQVHSVDPPSPSHSVTPRRPREEGLSRLLCSICQKEFKSLPALNGHMRSHGGGVTPKTTEGASELSQGAEPLSPLILPVSVPVKLQPASSASPLWPRPPLKIGKGSGAQPERRSRPSPVPQVVTWPRPCPASRGGVLFQSQLRTAAMQGGTLYTPPPMLSPTRQGPGLFSSIQPVALPPGEALPPPSLRVRLRRSSSVDRCTDNVAPEEKLVEIEPQINIGACFQAEIPEVKSPSCTDHDAHNASLLWSPWDQESPCRQRVEDLLKMACSSVVPGGGTNTEYALHCLHECRGNIMAAVERMLMQKTLMPKSNALADYHYAGSDNWTLLEKKQLNKAFTLHSKDFILIQKMVKTKTVAQCVEYYYTWKKRLRLVKRPQARQSSLGSERGVYTPKSQDGPEEELDSVELDSIKQFNTNWSTEVEAAVANQIAGFAREIGTCSSTFGIGQVLNGPAQGSTPNPPAEMSRCSPAPQPALGSPSPTSRDTDLGNIFPCKECGKVFLKIKSRNAHMKTHRQQDDSLSWPPHVPPLSSLGGAPDSPHPSPGLPLLPCHHMEQVTPVCLQPEEEEVEEDENALQSAQHPLLQLQAGDFGSVEQL